MRRKKAVMLLCPILVVFCLWMLGIHLLVNGIGTKVTYTPFKVLDTDKFLMTSEGYILDTGADFSTFLSPNAETNSFWISPIMIADVNARHTIGSLRYGKDCKIGDGLYIDHFVYAMSSKTEFAKAFPHVNGVIGMNVLHNANWLFLLKSQKAESLPLDSMIRIPNAAIVLCYRDKLSPKVDIDINGHSIKNVLIDTGFDNDLALDANSFPAILNFSEQIKQESVNNISLNAKRTKENITFKSVRINSDSYNDIVVNSSNKNLLGLRFIRRFDYLFWDSKHQKVYLWR